MMNIQYVDDQINQTLSIINKFEKLPPNTIVTEQYIRTIRAAYTKLQQLVDLKKNLVNNQYIDTEDNCNHYPNLTTTQLDDELDDYLAKDPRRKFQEY